MFNPLHGFLQYGFTEQGPPRRSDVLKEGEASCWHVPIHGHWYLTRGVGPKTCPFSNKPTEIKVVCFLSVLTLLYTVTESGEEWREILLPSVYRSILFINDSLCSPVCNITSAFSSFLLFWFSLEDLDSSLRFKPSSVVLVLRVRKLKSFGKIGFCYTTLWLVFDSLLNKTCSHVFDTLI